MGRIVAIGGGEIAEGETESIDRYVCDLVEEDAPSVLFVPTASGDAAGYRETFETYYGSLGCRVRHLAVSGGAVEMDQVRAKVDWADVVYVGGGNTRVLVDRWQELGVGSVIRDAYRGGTVLTGLSAGAMCWFESGLSDTAQDAEYTGIDCLGWVEDVACTPHAHPLRRAAFREHLEPIGRSGFAIENRCAIDLADGQYRVVTETGTETAYRYEHRDGGVRATEVPDDGEWRSLGSLR